MWNISETIQDRNMTDYYRPLIENDNVWPIELLYRQWHWSTLEGHFRYCKPFHCFYLKNTACNVQSKLQRLDVMWMSNYFCFDRKDCCMMCDLLAIAKFLVYASAASYQQRRLLCFHYLPSSVPMSCANVGILIRFAQILSGFRWNLGR